MKQQQQQQLQVCGEQDRLAVTFNSFPVSNQYLLYCRTEVSCSFCRLNNNQITQPKLHLPKNTDFKDYGGFNYMYSTSIWSCLHFWSHSLSYCASCLLALSPRTSAVHLPPSPFQTQSQPLLYLFSHSHHFC